MPTGNPNTNQTSKTVDAPDNIEKGGAGEPRNTPPEIPDDGDHAPQEIPEKA